MRRAVAALLTVEGVDLLDEEDRKIFARSDGLAPEWAEVPVFLTNAASRHDLLLHHFWRAEVHYHYLALSPGSKINGSELEEEWRLLIERTEGLLPTLDPDIAVGFAQPLDVDADPVDYGKLCSDRTKLVLTPWTFLGPDRVDQETRRYLEVQAGISSKVIAKGLTVAAVATPGLRPDYRFLEMIEARADLAYADPLLGEG